jgi:small subunit ribosomal protein S17
MSTQSHAQTIQGTVAKVSNATTIKVSTKVTKVHPLYRKRYSQMRHYVAHSPNNTLEVGDSVTIITCRPISKTKHWIVMEGK